MIVTPTHARMEELAQTSSMISNVHVPMAPRGTCVSSMMMTASTIRVIMEELALTKLEGMSASAGLDM